MRVFVKDHVMRWSLSISIVVALISIAVKSDLLCADQITISPSSQLELGDFVSIKYLEVLEETRSPLTAEGGRAINLVVVQKKEDVIEVMPIMNFHEGGPTFLVDQSGTVKLENAAGLEASHYTVQILNKKEISVGFNHFPQERFVFVKDLQRVISSKSITGRYVDRESRLYEFKSNGMATTPTMTFKFTVGTDHVPYHFDYIENADTHQIYRFVTEKCHLDIYEVLDAVENQHGNDGSNVKLFASLREIDCKEK